MINGRGDRDAVVFPCKPKQLAVMGIECVDARAGVDDQRAGNEKWRRVRPAILAAVDAPLVFACSLIDGENISQTLMVAEQDKRIFIKKR